MNNMLSRLTLIQSGGGKKTVPTEPEPERSRDAFATHFFAFACCSGGLETGVLLVDAQAGFHWWGWLQGAKEGFAPRVSATIDHHFAFIQVPLLGWLVTGFCQRHENKCNTMDL